MREPVSHILIPGLRKSANVFIRRAIEQMLGCPFVRFVDAWDEAQPDPLKAFFGSERAVGGEHLAGSAHNLAMLAAHRVTRIAVLMRDPRDALISWWHHLERPDIKSARLRAPVPNTFVPPDYYTLAPEQKLRELITPGMATLQAWMAAWIDVAGTSSSLRVHFNRFEDFAVDQRGAVGAMLAFCRRSTPVATPAFTHRPISAAARSAPIATRRRPSWCG
jgi:hypothetical protein